MTRSLIAFGLCLVLGACSSPKQPYEADHEPDDLPPTERYELIRLALVDELGYHPDSRELYLCQSPRQVVQLQKDVPQHSLHHAALTYTRVADGWPVAFCQRYSDDAIITRVEIDVIALLPESAVTRLYIGTQYPNMREVTLKFQRQAQGWRIVSRERPEPLKI